MNLTIRDCTANDIRAIVLLMEELGYPTKYEEINERFESISSDLGYCTLVAETSGKVIGMIGLHQSFIYERNGVNVRVIALVVKEEYRGKGVGKQLLLSAESWAMKQNAVSISLNSGNRPEREDAHLFYQKMGFLPKSTGFVRSLAK